MAQGYVDNQGDHSNHLNFSGWKYKAKPSWPSEEMIENGTNSVQGQLDRPSDGTGAVNVPRIQITSQHINLEAIKALKDNALFLANNFGFSVGTMDEIPENEDFIENEDNATEGDTSTAGDGILDSILRMGGPNIDAPEEGDQVNKQTWESAANELEKLGVYANYSNYSNSGYAKYGVYYTDHTNTGHNRYNDHRNRGGWWCCYRQNNGHNQYNDHKNTGNSSSNYSNYAKNYSNYTNNYGNYSKTVYR